MIVNIRTINNMKPIAPLTILMVLLCGARCSKILVVFPMAPPSHYILGNSLARALAEAGHDVTMISPFEERNRPENGSYRDVVLTGSYKDSDDQHKINLFDMEDMNPFFNIPLLNFFGNKIFISVIEHPNVQNLLKSNEQFDVVIMEQFCGDAFKVLAHHFRAPLILFSTIGANACVNYLTANPSPPSYVPDAFLSYTPSMTFKQRLVNWLFTILSELNRQLFFYPGQDKLMKEYFPDAPDLAVLNYNVSLFFINSHESTNQPVPYVPNMINIGGFHVRAPRVLPKDLQEFMDSSKEGVVYFSLGSSIKPSQMSEEKRKAILAALGKLKQKVLWKWDEDTLPGKPDNIKLGKWFPQQDILAHPNVKLFITHGGLLSTTETVYHGVPILAFPVFGDQKMNAARAQMNGYGISLPFSEITEEKISVALDKLLNSSEYGENAKRRSRLMHDRPVKPIELAVYWVEYVIRHKWVPHLRVAGLDLPWYKYLLLDVISFVVLAFSGSLIVIYYAFTRFCGVLKKEKGKLKKN